MSVVFVGDLRHVILAGDVSDSTQQMGSLDSKASNPVVVVFGHQKPDFTPAKAIISIYGPCYVPLSIASKGVAVSVLPLKAIQNL